MQASHLEFTLRYLRKSAPMSETFSSELAALARGASLLHHGSVSELSVFNRAGELIHNETAIRRVSALLQKGHESARHGAPHGAAHAA